ncbi:spore germination protein [Anaerosolibacter carboniphilus]|uniref:Spore germination protein n=1 Tax=Anaerosolibacter carboniphilus TaxID=1417629 RepID=A0A841L323_9FIRM|nr:spore germination protein [Anaerosolibacter carboniphilus]
MKKKVELGSVDMMSFIVQASLGTRLLAFPRYIVEEAGNDAWISVLLGGFLVLVLALVLYWLAGQYPGLNGSEIVLRVYGKWFGSAGLIVISIHTLATMGLSLRTFGDSIHLYLLSETPLGVTAGILLLLSVYALRKGIKTIAALINILVPISILIKITLILLPMNRMDVKALLPILHGGIKPVTMGALEMLDVIYSFTIIAYILPYFKEAKGTPKWIAAGIGIATSLYLGIVSMCIMVFGAEETTYLLYPTMTLAKSLQFKAQLFERAESLFMAGWIIHTFLVIVLTYFVGLLNLKALFQTSKNNLLIYVQMPLIMALVYLPQDVVQLDVFKKYVYFLGRIIVLVFMPVAAAIAFYRNRRGDHGA